MEDDSFRFHGTVTRIGGFSAYRVWCEVTVALDDGGEELCRVQCDQAGNVQVPAVGTRVSLMRVRRQYMDAVLLLDSFADQEPVGDDLVQESLEEARDLWDDTTDVTLRPRFTRT